jgi:hypothetical protein
LIGRAQDRRTVGRHQGDDALLSAPARLLLLTVAVTCTAWSLGAPIAGRLLYRTPEQQPRGATKLLFYCHLG